MSQNAFISIWNYAIMNIPISSHMITMEVMKDELSRYGQRFEFRSKSYS